MPDLTMPAPAMPDLTMPAPAMPAPARPGPATTPADLRPLMAAFPSGVSVVTAYDALGRPWGMTCTSLASVALDPPTLVVCLRVGGPTLRAALESGGFTVNLLDEEARRVADLFASGDAERFARVDWDPPRVPGGPHLTSAALAVADCRVLRAEQIGDHMALFGEVAHVAGEPHRDPLLYGRRRYARWSQATAVPPPEGSLAPRPPVPPSTAVPAPRTAPRPEPPGAAPTTVAVPATVPTAVAVTATVAVSTPAPTPAPTPTPAPIPARAFASAPEESVHVRV